ncbi:unnamed protein product [Protopolystoma xenopodis]|uniref:Uncharacterized protein n=1 Tax=Protopolystoma xenopodis TaxID=117903 RepID=A0A3S5BXF6_9PLAT|nr:unnamed protein product [Protopolystoma xenopodis]
MAQLSSGSSSGVNIDSGVGVLARGSGKRSLSRRMLRVSTLRSEMLPRALQSTRPETSGLSSSGTGTNADMNAVRFLSVRISMASRIKEHQRLCRNMNTERSEIAEHIALTGHEIEWKSIERLATYGESTRKRKMQEAIDIRTEINLMSRRLEVCFDKFAYRCGPTEQEADSDRTRMERIAH